MNTALAVALITALVTATGWVVTYTLTSRSQQAARVHAAELERVDNQLAKLYGPLAVQVIAGDASFQDLLRQLNRPMVFLPKKPLSEEELELWLFWVDNDLMPRNEVIQNIVATNAHLFDGPMPTSFREYLEHFGSWRIRHLRWKQESRPYSWHSETPYPATFNSDVLQTLDSLRQRQRVLLRRRSGR